MVVQHDKPVNGTLSPGLKSPEDVFRVPYYGLWIKTLLSPSRLQSARHLYNLAELLIVTENRRNIYNKNNTKKL